jgi:hypothetical protein
MSDILYTKEELKKRGFIIDQVVLNEQKARWYVRSSVRKKNKEGVTLYSLSLLTMKGKRRDWFIQLT